MTDATNKLNQPVCSGPVYELAGQFLGTWKEYTVTEEGEILVGTLTTRFELDGCVLEQSFISPDGGFRFKSFGHVDRASGQWQETYVFNDGRAASYRWRPEDEEIIIERIGGNQADLRRLRVRFVNPDFYAVTEEQSLDTGANWEPVEVTHTRRI